MGLIPRKGAGKKRRIEWEEPQTKKLFREGLSQANGEPRS